MNMQQMPDGPVHGSPWLQRNRMAVVIGLAAIVAIVAIVAIWGRGGL